MTTYVETLRPMQSRAAARPKLLTTPYLVLLTLAGIAIALVVLRFAVGLGRTTAMSDGYPWGIWIAFDVVTGTALACGGYAMALMVYIFNKGKYHPMVRPAILTSALGYSIAGLSVMVDVGRPWYAWKLPLPWEWNLNSVLLEVALCIMAYVVVLWIELSPAFFEKFKDRGPAKLQQFSRTALRFFEKALIWIVALGILLPTMHQSSLGSLMMLAGPRLHPLWLSPFLPLLFLVTCLAMGFAIVVFESTFSSISFGHRIHKDMLSNLGRAAAYGSVLFVVLRFADLAFRGNLGFVARPDQYAFFFWLETLLFLAPVGLLLKRGTAPSMRGLLGAAVSVALAGALYRFDTYLLAFNPGPGWHYFPSTIEQLITIGFVAGEIAVYIAVVKYFPILRGIEKTAPSVAH